MLISVFALLEGSVSSLLIAVEKKYTQTHMHLTPKKKKKEKVKKLKKLSRKTSITPFHRESDSKEKENEDSCKKYIY